MSRHRHSHTTCGQRPPSCFSLQYLHHSDTKNRDAVTVYPNHPPSGQHHCSKHIFGKQTLFTGGNRRSSNSTHAYLDWTRRTYSSTVNVKPNG